MISNLRDLGGIRGAWNRKIRNGMLIRSASLCDALQ
ncbi:MAG: tyrosine-protein phosphatase [Clostridiales bacterium]|nr:tyrosine-protein phosphatase [Clostridiales bacterium]